MDGAMKILLLGKGGQVGWELQRALAPLGGLVSHDARSADFSEPDTVARLVRAERPDVIVNAAAYTAVDQAESQPQAAHLINAETPGVLAREAQALNALLVHYSTDYVFDGSGTVARDETSTTAPLNVYGQTKLLGEQLIRSSGCAHLIFRTSWVYAARGGNFAKTMLRLAGERDTLNVIDDQIGAPTGAELLADVTAHALVRARQRPALQGLYHVAASGETSWFQYARFVIEWARSHGHPMRLAPDQLRPISTDSYPTPAARPRNSRLDCRRFEQAFEMRLPAWQQGVERMLTEHLGL